jgi:transposase
MLISKNAQSDGIFLPPMYFEPLDRRNPTTGEPDNYYRIMRSVRVGRKMRHITVLSVGFIDKDWTRPQLKEVGAALESKYTRQPLLFELSSEKVKSFVEYCWDRIVAESRLDVNIYDPQSQHVVIDTITHEKAREAGAEWLALNAWKDLRLDEALQKGGLNTQEIKFAQTQVISRAIYPCSELATAKVIRHNSAICELTGFPIEKVNKDRLYEGARKLYKQKDALELHLSKRTNEIFNYEEKIILYDLTNTYFEGVKRDSKLAKYGRSKEKRSDAKLVVLALAVNPLGFIKYSSIHEGNFSDTSDITAVLDRLIANTGIEPKTVVLDAGIATNENLEIIQSKGYNYICVSRSKLKDYSYQNNSQPQTVLTKGDKTVYLKKIQSTDNTNYFFEIDSPAKALKETGMKNKFEELFEEQLMLAKKALTTAKGTKRINKVHERIGRAKEKYASTHSRYIIEVIEDKENDVVTDILWTKNEIKEEEKITGLGRYFLRTNMDLNEEPSVWHTYNIIREVEDTFRTLKTDLDLRPIWHKNDENTQAHLHLGILAYWLVNTIRCKLKTQGINVRWPEIVRIASTQKFITTKGLNTAGKKVETRKCSEPEPDLEILQKAMGVRRKPFRIELKIKDVPHTLVPKKSKAQSQRTIRQT